MEILALVSFLIGYIAAVVAVNYIYSKKAK
jgi:hypothetical protein